jgi:nickel/cobalt transporter (NicO) family protein
MIDATMLLLGIGLGLRHATDADHIVVVSTVLEREPDVLPAVRIAALWGFGHTLSFLALGLLVVVAGVRVPADFELFVELLVAAMLVILGLWHLRRSLSPAAPMQVAQPRTAGARPLLIGLVHGLAGSAGIALVVTTTIPSRVLGTVYLLLFGVGTVAGMIVVTTAMSWPICWAARRKRHAGRIARGLAAGITLVLGVALLVKVLF